MADLYCWPKKEKENLDEIAMWEIFPDSLLLKVFSFLSPKEIALMSSVCRRWYNTGRDELLWKRVFAWSFGVDHNCDPSEFFVSWFKEFQRLYSETPVVETQILTEHSDEVLHVAFSHDGKILSSSSKDCSAILWDVKQGEMKLREKLLFQKYRWEYVQFCEFNCDDSFLLVSGVNLKRNFNFQGEIFIYKLSKSQSQHCVLLRTITSEPYDIFGAWLTDSNFISGSFEFMADNSSVSELLGNCLFSISGERQFSLCRVLNHNSSSVRTVLVARPKFTSKASNPDQVTLIFTHGTTSYTPHQIILQKVNTHNDGLSPLQTEFSTQVKGDGANVSHSDAGRDIIETNSHIIGMNLSPDHNLLYVNCRKWLSEGNQVGPDATPRISTDIHLNVYDLASHKLVKVHRGHQAFTPNDGCFFIFLDVAEKMVASGAEDCLAHVWERHYKVKLASLTGHTDVVNSVSFNPKNPETLVSASDDHTIRVWSSRKKAKELKRRQYNARLAGISA